MNRLSGNQFLWKACQKIFFHLTFKIKAHRVLGIRKNPAAVLPPFRALATLEQL